MVLLLGTVILLIALAANTAIFEGARATRLGLDEIRVDDLAQSGLDLAAAVLSIHPSAGHDVTRTEYTLRTGTLRLTMRNEAGRFDVNLTSPILLRWLIMQFGADPVLAVRLADEIADWRQPSRSRRSLGAKDADYQARGRAVPARRPFADVAELAQVLDMPDDLFLRIAPILTTTSGVEQMNLAIADPALLRLLTSRSEADPAGFAERASVQDLVKALPSEVRSFFGSVFSEAVRVTVEASVGGLQRKYEGVVRLSRNAADQTDDFIVLSWHRVSP